MNSCVNSDKPESRQETQSFAITREYKYTSKDIDELYYKGEDPLRDFSSWALIAALKHRAAVDYIAIGPYDPVELKVEGPRTILLVK